MTTITWVHLSDLHLRDVEEGSTERKDFESLLDDIASCREDHHLGIDAVFFTGDIAFSGRESEYLQAMDWFDDVLNACGLAKQRNRFFIVPGNHDVDRGTVNETENMSRFHRFLSQDILKSEDCARIDTTLKKAEERKLVFQKFSNYALFIERYFGDPAIKFDYKNYFFVRPITKDAETVLVVGLNSAWLSFEDDEQGRLIIGERQVTDALREAQRFPDSCWRIALVHHPIYWLAEKDIHCMQQLIPGNFDLLLRGHLHCPSFSIQSTPENHLHELAAGASLKSKYRAYNLTQLNLDTGKGTAFVRIQHKDLGHWDKDLFTYRNTDGRIDFQLRAPHIS